MEKVDKIDKKIRNSNQGYDWACSYLTVDSSSNNIKLMCVVQQLVLSYVHYTTRKIWTARSLLFNEYLPE